MIEKKTSVIIDKTKGYKLNNYHIVDVIDDLLVYYENDNFGLLSLNSKNGDPSLITKPIYKQFKQYKYGQIVARVNGEDVLLDSTGKVLLKMDQIEIIRKDLYKITSDNDIYLVNETFSIITRKPYSRIDFINDDRAITSTREGRGVISSDGTELIPNKYDGIEACDYGYLVTICKSLKSRAGYNTKYINGLISKEGKTLIEPKYEKLVVIDDKTALIWKKDKWILIDYKGKKLKKLDLLFKEIGQFEGKYAIAKMEMGSCLIDKQFNIKSEIANYIISGDTHYIMIYDTTHNNLIDKDTLEESKSYADIRPFTKQGIAMVHDLPSGFKLINKDYKEIYHAGHNLRQINIKDNLIVTLKAIQKIENNVSIPAIWVSGIIDIEGREILKSIQTDNKILIVNAEQVIIDDYLFNIDELKVIYQLNICYNNSNLIKDFESEEQLKEYEQKFEKLVIPYLNNKEKQIDNHIKKWGKVKEKQLTKTFLNADRIMKGSE